MPNAPKFFQVATEGPTIDGRQIKRAWLEEAAAHYDPRLYAARINLEHLTSYFPDSTFRQYGDVLALRAEELKEGPLKGRMALFAQIAPRPELVTITKDLGQKLYTSIEVYENFAGTGHAYVTAIAVTDTPASVGTQRLEFNTQRGGLVSALTETENPFLAAVPADNKDDAYMKKEDFIAGLKAIFAPAADDSNNTTAESSTAPSGATEGVAPELEALSTALATLKEGQDKAAGDTKAALARLEKLAADLGAAVDAQKQAHDALVEKLAKEPATPERKPATGATSDMPDFI
jgi:hypothetical protein